jgi:hypothetical protein
MGNMSYCRFQNTARDLDDCLAAVEESLGDLSELSADERRAARRLFDLCVEFIETVDEDTLDGPTSFPINQTDEE